MTHYRFSVSTWKRDGNAETQCSKRFETSFPRFHTLRKRKRKRETDEEENMERYKYQLEKYSTKATRHECPHCKTKNSFARYVDERNEYISPEVGRCNREDKCGYHLTPREYFANKGETYQKIIHVEQKPLPPTDYIPEDIMIRSLNTNNHLITFLMKYFSAKDIAHTINKYRIGDTRDGRVIYWQIDELDRVRTGKMMLYNPETGHRVKNVPNAFDWAHRHGKRDYQLEQCLYGLHLIKRESQPIAIVESEKSAILASLAIPGYVWTATGGKQNFRLMEVVKGRDVTLFPDLGAFEQWSEHAGKFGFKVSSLLEDIATPEDRESGLDIADYIINELNSKNYERKVS